MKVMLIISFLVNGNWIPAEELKLRGWYPREQANMKVCLLRAEHINKNSIYSPYIKADCIIKEE